MGLTASNTLQRLKKMYVISSEFVAYNPIRLISSSYFEYFKWSKCCQGSEALLPRRLVPRKHAESTSLKTKKKTCQSEYESAAKLASKKIREALFQWGRNELEMELVGK